MTKYEKAAKAAGWVRTINKPGRTRFEKKPDSSYETPDTNDRAWQNLCRIVDIEVP